MPRKKAPKKKKGKEKSKCAGCVWGERIQEERYRCFFPQLCEREKVGP